MRKYAFIIAAILIMPIGVVCAYSSGDNSNRLSNASSSVFSPGYINAAKQKTDAVIGQNDPKKSFFERLVDNIKGGVEKNVGKAVNTKATVEVKKKTSTRNTARRGDTPIVMSPNVDTGEIPAYIRDEIQKYIGDHNNGYAGDYTLKKSNGNYYAFWNDSYTSIKAQTFNSEGGAISGSLSSLTGGRSLISALISNVTVLPGGSVAAFWIEVYSNYNYSLKTQTFNSKGGAISESLSTLTGDRLLNGALISNVTVLHNGSIAVFWYERDLNNKYSIKTQRFNSKGIAIDESLSTLTEDRLLNNAYISNVTVLPNGSVAVFWSEQGSNNKYSLKTQRFNSNGIAIDKSLSTLTGDRLLDGTDISRVAILPDDSIAVFWYECDLSNIYSIKTQSFNSSGIAIDGSLYTLTGDRLLNGIYIGNVTIIPNDGSVAVF